jgi:CelD/BcsL family acetyltransferase involved in cellulose biosynthesis
MDRAGAGMIERFDAVEALPADARALLEAAGREEFQLGAAWFATVAAHARPPGARPVFLTYREAGAVIALLPLWRARDGRWRGLASPYTCLFRPLVASAMDAAALTRAGRGFGAAVRRGGTARLDALDPEWPPLAPLLAGFRQAGLLAFRFAHFAAWSADVAGQDWDSYLAGRPGAPRETIRRRLAHADRAGLTFEVIAGGDALDAGIAAYEPVHARSWKPAEPFPAFIPAITRAAAAAGVLRLGLLRRGETPIAAQLWTVLAGAARLEKLVHDEAERRLSPGTALTALMIRHLLARETVASLDFGRGDDAYKAGWTGRRREREGVLLCAPWHPAGLFQAGRHLAGRAARRSREWVGQGRRGG